MTEIRRKKANLCPWLALFHWVFRIKKVAPVLPVYRRAKHAIYFYAYLQSQLSLKINLSWNHLNVISITLFWIKHDKLRNSSIKRFRCGENFILGQVKINQDTSIHMGHKPLRSHMIWLKWMTWFVIYTSESYRQAILNGQDHDNKGAVHSTVQIWLWLKRWRIKNWIYWWTQSGSRLHKITWLLVFWYLKIITCTMIRQNKRQMGLG